MDVDDTNLLAQRVAQDRAAVTQEFERYLEEPVEDIPDIEQNGDLFTYWTAKRHIFPYMYCVSRDVLAMQATSVVVERIFSSSKETDTLRRNQLHPALMEALQVLKYRYRQECLDFAGDLIARIEQPAMQDDDDSPPTRTA
ncbi:hypothetical protein DICSQDRAFT_171084 [Dichomitus squalens LYAD-421 SS1]|uniref:HAT C-terminal dimerisation domain-containing protein n=1 Tax=Dichomitus squalens (strain LYAD-421) TaxID=732165 RepID=R7SVY8_DICSQ|nr:uncharacterized protein DICSQDRAFT_171084 [Dichomitus squalens LYAD-421 SS1]EJF60364.1 hypothetical protein DICSQDRAFT_171084 [Dichomitus squalens LYAD-421 SS1]